jgi:hypothetical protein
MQSVDLNVFKVFHEARTVFGTVPVIELLHPPAWIFDAIVAEFGFCVGQECAVEDDTINAVRDTHRQFITASGTTVFLPQIAQANTTVHPARSDQDFIGRGWVH